MNSDFGFGKVVDVSFDDAIEKVTAELEKEGFGVLSDIDVAAKMKAKLDKDMPRYRILGACNPALAFQAISAVEDMCSCAKTQATRSTSISWTPRVSCLW
jgi:uncharacterized protein (DUF302 family)